MKNVPQSLILIGLSYSTLIALAPRVSAQGGVPLWTNVFYGPSTNAYVPDQSHPIAVNSSGTVFVTGYCNGANSSDAATMTYSNAGVPLWTNYFGPINGRLASEVDNGGNVFVTVAGSTIKYSASGMPLWTNRGGSETIALDLAGNVFVTDGFETIAYSNAGALLWTNRYTGPGNSDYAWAIAVDSGGNILVTGQSAGDGTDSDYATVKYSNAGVPIWTNRYNGPANSSDQAFAIAADSSSNVFVTGTLFRQAALNRDYATIKYSSAGVPLWTNRYDVGIDDEAWAIAVDSNGNAFVTGSSYAGVGVCCDYATIKYSSAGVPVWTRRYNGPGNSQDIARAVVVDGAGNVIVAGESYGISGSSDYATIAYSNDGVPLWTNRYPRGAGTAVGLDSRGNVFVTGHAAIGDNNSAIVTIKYSSSVPGPHLDFQKLNSKLVLSWTNSSFNLQSSPTVTGTYTNIPGATSPHTNSLTAPRQFFRLIQEL